MTFYKCLRAFVFFFLLQQLYEGLLVEVLDYSFEESRLIIIINAIIVGFILLYYKDDFKKERNDDDE